MAGAMSQEEKKQHCPGACCTAAAWTFARMEEVWSRFRPRTPYGKDYAVRRVVRSDPAGIELALDETEACAAFAARNADSPLTADKVAWHLARIPRIPPADGGSGAEFDISEIFQFKKFLWNYSGLCALLDRPMLDMFGMSFRSGGLLAVLDKGGSGPETFQIADGYDEGLRETRTAILALSERLAWRRAAQEKAVRESWGIGFEGREFVMVPMETGLVISAREGEGKAELSVESYDEHSCLVRLIPDSATLGLERERAALRDRERAIETRIRAALSGLIAGEADNFREYIAVLTRLDLAFARLAMKETFGLARPDLSARSLAIREGRFIPLLDECAARGTGYTPLDVGTGKRAAVLFGSNMGGKTVVLQTVLFLQIMAQAGFHVPAASFSSRVFPFIDYVGEGTARLTRGLSGFGFEIFALCKALRQAESVPALVAFDEFARTTSSEEAEALLSAVISRFSEGEGLALFSTHFRGVAREPNAQYFRMAGLDVRLAREAFSGKDASSPREAEAGATGAAGVMGAPVGASVPPGTAEVQAGTLESRIRRINEMMRYKVLDEMSGAAGQGGSDALEVASLLGLDGRMVAKAEEYARRGRVQETRYGA